VLCSKHLEPDTCGVLESNSRRRECTDGNAMLINRKRGPKSLPAAGFASHHTKKRATVASGQLQDGVYKVGGV